MSTCVFAKFSEIALKLGRGANVTKLVSGMQKELVSLPSLAESTHEGKALLSCPAESK
jgi:hypothetical protein